MRTKVETITPKKAGELLEKHWVKDRQRKPSDQTVDAYARVMRIGQWKLTHQGIGVNEKGELIDGVHRLLAVQRSGATVQMVVSYDVPDNGAKNGIYAIDVIDRGRLRSIGDQLALRHNIKNGKLIASVARGVLCLCARSKNISTGRFDVPDCLSVLDFYGDEINYCVDRRSQDYRVRNAPAIAASAFVLRAYPQQGREFYEQLTKGEKLKTGDPAMTCRRWLFNSHPKGGGAMQDHRAVLTCAMKFVLNEKITKVYDNEHGYTFFLEKQGRAVEGLLKARGYGERVL